jgi:hypothetical protein
MKSMKLSYDQETRKFVVSELGRILDLDIDSDALVARYGFVALSVEDEMTGEKTEDSQNSWPTTEII